MSLVSLAQTPAGKTVPVTADNFNRAETDINLVCVVKRGALGKFIHTRDLPLESAGLGSTRDTLYSEAVFDLDAGPVKITLPNPGNRFMSMLVINEDHYVYEVDYGGGNYAFTRSEILDVLLSISFSTPATSPNAEIRHKAKRAVSASNIANRCSKVSGRKFLRARSDASCQRSFCPWLRNSESS